MYPKKAPTLKKVENAVKNIMSHSIENVNHVPVSSENTLMQAFENANNSMNEVDTGNVSYLNEERDDDDHDDTTKKSSVKTISLKGSGKRVATSSVNKTSVSELLKSKSTTGRS